MTPPSVAAGSDKPTRDERRRRTEAAILAAARESFAEAGFERTTIRAVAARAGVDPALVMQHFGSKEGLFAASARWFAEHRELTGAGRDGLARAALHDLLEGMEDPEKRCAATAVLRSCLTHESARQVMREEVIADKHARLAAVIGGDDAELRAGLLAAIMIGTSMARYLLEIPSVANASAEDVERVLAPVLEALVGPEPE